MRDRLVLLDSPFQIESAIHSIGLSRSDKIIIRLSDIPSNDDKMKRLCDGLEVEYFKIGSGKQLIVLFATLKFLLKYFSFKGDIYIGNFDSGWMKLLSKLPAYKNCYFIDDGLLTVSRYYNFKKNAPKTIVNIISRFPLKSDLSKKISVQHTPIKRIIKQTTDNVIIIGGALSRNGVITEGDYKVSLKKIVDDNKGSKITFIPHRYEDESIIAYMHSLCEIKIIDMSIEEYIESMTCIPKTYCSFTSTSLFNIASRYESINVLSYDITKHFVDEKIEQHYGFVYEFFEECCIDLITIKR